MRNPLRVKRTWLSASCVALGLLVAAPAAAQTFDDLFDPSVLHDIRLVMKAEDWQTLKDHFLEDTYYRADFHWRDVTVPIVGVRSRGSGSRNPHKPGLKIAFDEYIDGQKPFGLKSVVLANGIQDPVMVKQRLGLGMFTRMDLPSPRVIHARLFVNEEYIGLYQLIEPVDKLFLARVYGKDQAGKVENGGYLYEYNWKSDIDWTYLGPELEHYAELFEAKTHETDAPSILYGPIEELFRRINDASDSQFEAEIGPLVDLPQFARYLAVDNFIADYDGFLGAWGANNFYVYRFQGQTLTDWLPWDKDLAYWHPQYDIFQGVEGNVLARRVLSMPLYRKIYLETLRLCAVRASEAVGPDNPMGWLEAETRRALDQVRAAAYADENKRFNNERFDDEAEKVLRFARQRAPFVWKEATDALERMGSFR